MKNFTLSCVLCLLLCAAPLCAQKSSASAREAWGKVNALLYKGRPSAEVIRLGVAVSDSLGLKDTTLSVLRYGVKLYPDDPDLRATLAFVLMRSDKLQEARAVLDVAKKRWRRQDRDLSAAIYSAMGSKELVRRRWKEAQQQFRLSLGEARTADAAQGMVYSSIQLNDCAGMDYGAAEGRKARPEMSLWYRAMAQCAAERRDFDAAAAHARAALAREPHDAALGRQTLELVRSSGKMRDAIALADSLRASFPADTALLESAFTLYAFMDDTARGFSALDAMVRLQPERSAEVALERAGLFVRAGDTAAGYAAVERASAALPRGERRLLTASLMTRLRDTAAAVDVLRAKAVADDTKAADLVATAERIEELSARAALDVLAKEAERYAGDTAIGVVMLRLMYDLGVAGDSLVRVARAAAIAGHGGWRAAMVLWLAADTRDSADAIKLAKVLSAAWHENTVAMRLALASAAAVRKGRGPALEVRRIEDALDSARRYLGPAASPFIRRVEETIGKNSAWPYVAQARDARAAGDTVAEEQYLKTALARDAAQPYALARMAEIHLSRGEHGLAWTSVLRALDAAPEPDDELFELAIAVAVAHKSTAMLEARWSVIAAGTSAEPRAVATRRALETLRRRQ